MNKTLFVDNEYVNIFIFPCFNGNFCVIKNNGVLCTVRHNGSVNVQSFKLKFSPINNNIVFLRGIEYLIFGTYYFFYGLYLSFKNTPLPTISQKISSSLNIKSSYVFGSVALLLSGLIAFLMLGVIPTHLGFVITKAKLSFFLKKIFIALIKIVMFYLLLLFLYSFASIRKLYRFNSAGNIVLNAGDVLPLHRATNYLNFIVFGCIVNYFVVSIIGVNVSVWLKPLLNFFILVGSFSVAYEVCYVFDKYLKKYSHITLMTSFFVNKKPASTEIQTAQTVLSEGNLMVENAKREVISEDSQGGNVPFSLCYSEVREKLKLAGIDDKAETDWLIATVLNKNRAEIKLLTQISRTDYKEIQRVLARRVKGEPIDNIFGKTEFYGLTFKVNKDVLTPRQETEILVEEAIRRIGKEKYEVLDLCTGSGAIAIAIAKNTQAKVYGSDISESALEIAKQNANFNNVKISFTEGDMFSGIKKNKKFDIITCNPPYIKSDDIKKLDKEVKNYDPLLALDGGEDGLYFYRKLAKECIDFLKPDGVILMEIGKGQAQNVKKLFSKQKFNVIVVKDYSGIQRVVIAERRQNVRKN